MDNTDIASVILIIVISIYEDDYNIGSVFENFFTTIGEIISVYFSIVIGLFLYNLVFPTFEKIIIDALLGSIIEKFESLQLIKKYIEYILGFFSFLWDINLKSPQFLQNLIKKTKITELKLGYFYGHYF